MSEENILGQEKERRRTIASLASSHRSELKNRCCVCGAHSIAVTLCSRVFRQQGVAPLTKRQRPFHEKYSERSSFIINRPPMYRPVKQGVAQERRHEQRRFFIPTRGTQTKHDCITSAKCDCVTCFDLSGITQIQQSGFKQKNR